MARKSVVDPDPILDGWKLAVSICITAALWIAVFYFVFTGNP